MKVKLIILIAVLLTVIIAVFASNTLEAVVTPNTPRILEAAEAAEAELEGIPYSWTDSRLTHCSGFVSRYLTYLGLPTTADSAGPSDYQPTPSSLIPNSNTKKQVLRFQLLDEQVGLGFTFMMTVDELLRRPNDWPELGIEPGALVYFTAAESHNGYNEWYHVAIVLGYTETNTPVLADFASGMANGPMLGRSLHDVATGIYQTNNLGEHDITPAGNINNPGAPLRAFVVNTLGLADAVEDQAIFVSGS